MKSGNIIKKVLKIKEVFPSLKSDKINNIQKIIKDDSRPKPRINMTTKRPFRKQVIVLINNNNKTKFIKDSNNHITNLNRALKNIKSEIIVDFVQLDNSGVIIVTNKVILALKLQTIEKYIKNTNYIEVKGIKVISQNHRYLLP